MRRAINLIRKTAIFIVGFIVVIIGIILIPLPGPGILVMIAGLAILAIEFEWAEHHHKKVKNFASRSLDKLNDRLKD